MPEMVQIDIRAIRRGLKKADKQVADGNTKDAQHTIRVILEAVSAFNYNNPDAHVIVSLIKEAV